jgi:hypothetical protein
MIEIIFKIAKFSSDNQPAAIEKMAMIKTSNNEGK